MYQPPNGRPQSSPPEDMFSYSSKPDKPKRRPGETHTDYGARVAGWMRGRDEQLAKDWASRTATGLKAALRRDYRQAVKAAKKLNATETRGVWVTAKMLVEHKLFPTISAAREASRRHSWEKQSAGAYRLYLLPRDSEQYVAYMTAIGAPLLPPAAPVAPAAPPPVTPAAPPPVDVVPVPVTPPTVWQRFIAWFAR